VLFLSLCTKRATPPPPSPRTPFRLTTRLHIHYRLEFRLSTLELPCRPVHTQHHHCGTDGPPHVHDYSVQLFLFQVKEATRYITTLALPTATTLLHTNAQEPWACTSVGLAVHHGHVLAGIRGIPHEVVVVSQRSVHHCTHHQGQQHQHPSQPLVPVVREEYNRRNDVHPCQEEGREDHIEMRKKRYVGRGKRGNERGRGRE
jgi:hypothetical protein